MPPKIIYVTGFRQHAGKTVTCLGILSLLKKAIGPERIGYIKPVGQKISELPGGKHAENDAYIVKEFVNIEDLDVDIASPVKMGTGFTKEFLSKADPYRETIALQDNILEAVKTMAHKDIIIAEGTGHPGVGGIVGLSNAKVANLLNAEIIFLSGGGIGKALDMLEVDMTYFLYMKSRVRGIIFNRLIPEKIPGIRQYITEDLLNRRFPSVGGKMRILAFLPQIDALSNPSMRVILDELSLTQPIGNPNERTWSVPCKTIKIITLDSANFNSHKYLSPGSLVIIAASSRARLRKILEYNASLTVKGLSLAGIILTCFDENQITDAIRREIIDSGIPAISIPNDSASTEASIIQLFESTKLQVFDAMKFGEIQQLFEKHFDMDKFLDSFDIRL
jgi:uncharacterized protein